MAAPKVEGLVLSCLLVISWAHQRLNPTNFQSKQQLNLAELSSSAHVSHNTGFASLAATGEISSLKSNEATHISMPHSPGFFAGFAEGESTFDEDGNGPLDHAAGESTIGFVNGWHAYRSPNENQYTGDSNVMSHFEETPSASDLRAWQTLHRDNLPNVNFGGNAWYASGSDGSDMWAQVYPPSSVQAMKRHNQAIGPSWFETEVDQYDVFGRQRLPNARSPRSFIEWTERSVNSTLQCVESGCTASSTVVAFNPAIEEAQNCRLSLHVHPTDFDDSFSGERLEFIQGNNHNISYDCFPNARACNTETRLPTFNCLRDFPVDLLIDNGSLQVTAKISDVVDECPYDGNLLSAVPVVTCMVRPLTLQQPPPGPVLPNTTGCATIQRTFQAPLQCAERGCTAYAHIQLNGSDTPNETVAISNCRLNAFLNQTDFDGEEGSVEIVEFLNISTVNLMQSQPNITNQRSLASGVSPGVNPCGCEQDRLNQGAPLTQAEYEGPERIYQLITDEDVSSEAAGGHLEFAIKISDLVDECPSQGYLLDAMVEVTCDMTCIDPMA